MKTEKTNYIILLILVLVTAIGVAAYITQARRIYKLPDASQLSIAHRGNGTSIDVSTWKTYRNEQYGFEFRYPDGLQIEEYKNGFEYSVYAIWFKNINVRIGVSNAASRESYNTRCESDDTGMCIGFEFLRCESQQDVLCSEYSYVPIGGFWQKKASIYNQDQSLRGEFEVDFSFDGRVISPAVVLTDEIVFDSVASGQIDKRNEKNLRIFEEILSTFKFIR